MPNNSISTSIANIEIVPWQQILEFSKFQFQEVKNVDEDSTVILDTSFQTFIERDMVEEDLIAIGPGIESINNGSLDDDRTFYPSNLDQYLHTKCSSSND